MQYCCKKSCISWFLFLQLEISIAEMEKANSRFDFLSQFFHFCVYHTFTFILFSLFLFQACGRECLRQGENKVVSEKIMTIIMTKIILCPAWPCPPVNWNNAVRSFKEPSRKLEDKKGWESLSSWWGRWRLWRFLLLSWRASLTILKQVRRRRERRRSSQKEDGKGSRKPSQESSGLVCNVFVGIYSFFDDDDLRLVLAFLHPLERHQVGWWFSLWFGWLRCSWWCLKKHRGVRPVSRQVSYGKGWVPAWWLSRLHAVFAEW